MCLSYFGARAANQHLSCMFPMDAHVELEKVTRDCQEAWMDMHVRAGPLWYQVLTSFNYSQNNLMRVLFSPDSCFHVLDVKSEAKSS